MLNKILQEPDLLKPVIPTVPCDPSTPNVKHINWENDKDFSVAPFEPQLNNLVHAIQFVT